MLHKLNAPAALTAISTHGKIQSLHPWSTEYKVKVKKNQSDKHKFQQFFQSCFAFLQPKSTEAIIEEK